MKTTAATLGQILSVNLALIKDVIINLVDNSIKASSPGKRVWVSIKGNALSVRDEGIGIPEEDLNRIYERFFRVDKSRSREIGGTGLGLSITKSAILRHHGTISVESKEGEGTTFIVRIPLRYSAEPMELRVGKQRRQITRLLRGRKKSTVEKEYVEKTIHVSRRKYKPLAEDQYSNIENSWKHYTEAQSSAFWKRNLYPHNCRFLLFELDRHGKMREQRDYFKLWTAIVLLTVNPSDPDVLQAHRLYSLDVSFKKAELQQKLQESVDKLNKASYVLRKSLEKEEKKNMEENPELPKYRIGVPVSFALPRLSKLKFDTSQIPLAPDTDTEDLAVWNTYQRDASEELQLLIRSADRYLDQAAERLRYQSQYSEEEVYPLTSYQEEDLKNDLNTVYTGILRERELLPGGVTEAKRRTDSAEERVRERLLTRITAKEVATAVLLPVLLLLLSLAFGLINSKSPYWLPVLIAAAAAMLFVTACIILSLQKKALVNEIDAFQQTVQNTASEITQNSGVFSRFLSNISSHIHGKSFLDVMHARKMRRDNSYYLKVRNIKAINLLLNKIDFWSTALHAQVDLQSSQAMQYYDEDPDVDYDGLFSLQSVTRQPVPLNRSGSVVNAPFDFADHLEIEREEVYECQTSPE